jgi:membrane-bound ClpP family serine protease
MGKTGVTIARLCPGGKARFGEDLLDVITRGELIENGRTVRIIGHSGPVAIVEEVG